MLANESTKILANRFVIGSECTKWKWENVLIDIITKFPKTMKDRRVIWVIMNRLTKSTHFISEVILVQRTSGHSCT